MDQSVNLALPFIAPSQAQKHITHNEALRILDALVHLTVVAADVTTPPADPQDGDRYIVGAGATEEWEGQAGHVAAYQDGAWAFFAPNRGWLAWITTENRLLVWTGSGWIKAGGDANNPATLVGINTTADATNKLAVKSDAVLFSHDDVTPGTGSLQHKLNKASEDKTASILFQTGWSGRAEFGLTGDDDWHMKVSPDGANWKDALIVDRSTGETTVQGLRSAPAGGAAASSFLFTPGGDGVVSFYRINSTSTQNPRTATISSISGRRITLTAAVAGSIFESTMNGVSYARIWNTTQSADDDSAWVAALIDAFTLQVTSINDIAGWTAGDAIQIGDPNTITPNRCISFDISPMLTNLFGRVFRQSGIAVKAIIQSTNEGDGLGVSATGEGGSFIPAALAGASVGTTIVPCTEKSPISDSNLVRVREGIATTAGIRLLSSIAVLR